MDVTNLFHKECTSQKKTKTLGIYLFGLHLKILDTSRESKRRAHTLKPIDQCGNSTFTKWATSIGKYILAEFNEKTKQLYNLKDVPVLESVCYSVNKKHTFTINYENDDKIKKKQKLESIARALDDGNIPRDSYRRLCAIEYHLPREGEISKERININKTMAQLIPITIVDINTRSQVDESERVDIDDESITQEVIDAVGKAICLGFNSAHSKNFCPWCTIDKSQQGNLSKEWKISKEMEKIVEKINYYKGHTRKPLFDMIPLNHWISDELHIMLRITDHLWSLVIAELMEYGLFNDTARKIIVEEMKRIKVRFQFWQIQETKTWNYTSLMGNDKLKVLQFFDLTKILLRQRAIIIRNLWNKFYELYIKMKDQTTKAEDF
ncbi:hypothetical protein C1646_798783 [Rhizophagus diaphanus]|nr:hypothetical protein C1646_798783 [Rhizophagus diaphanus] [Rhizophagus sp. MUCL 43196]